MPGIGKGLFTNAAMIAGGERDVNPTMMEFESICRYAPARPVTEVAGYGTRRPPSRVGKDASARLPRSKRMLVASPAPAGLRGA